MTKKTKGNEGSDLMMKVSRGDEKAFESLVKLFRNNVVSTVYRYLGDSGVAEDLAQEVFLKIYQARQRYKPLAKFETWLHRIVFNVVVNESHHRRRRKALSLDACKSGLREELESTSRGSADPVEHLKRDELHGKVREAVLALPPNQRMVLILNKYEDMSYQEIADVQKTSVEAVKSMLFRAREKIRSRLVRYVQSEVPK
jgi:RNA polymerase sigma-70 factor (ECF subfamily)